MQTEIKFPFKRKGLPSFMSALSLSAPVHTNANATNHDPSFITKTYLYNLDPLKPHFYIVKLGFTGVYIIFLFLL